MMSVPFLTNLSRFGRQRVGLSWMATTILTASPRSMAQAATHSTQAGKPYEAIRELASRIQQSEAFRSPRVQDPSNRTSKLEEKRLRSELAKEVCENYKKLLPLKLPLAEYCERNRIISYLSTECSPTNEALSAEVHHYNNKKSLRELTPRIITIVTSNIRKASTPVYEEILEYILKQDAVNGMQFLVALREDVLRALQWIRSSSNDDERLAHLEDLDAYLLRLFSLWFSPGMLVLKRITYDETPASVIEFIATREAVHPMKNLDDLRTRLGAGRRVLALFHPLLKNEPLLFVHVALTDDIPSSMAQVMEVLPNDNPTCATFYSITNAQPGLAGIGLGEYLLKESIGLLHREFSSLRTFVTLSPMPKFRKWLEEKIHQNAEHGRFFDDSVVTEEDWAVLAEAGVVEHDSSWNSFFTALVNVDFSQAADLKHMTALRPILTKLAARYIVLEKHRGKPLDVVARFHLSNGAVVHRINFGADLSRKGIQNSFGIMMNYRYDLDTAEDNQRAFEACYDIQTSDDVSQWLPATPGQPRSKL